MTTPEAGWYTDPADSRGQRWWTGTEWTADLAPQPAPPHWPRSRAEESPSNKVREPASFSDSANLDSSAAGAALPGTALLPLPAGHTPMAWAEATEFAPGGTGPRPAAPARSRSVLIWSLAVGCGGALFLVAFFLLQ